MNLKSLTIFGHHFIGDGPLRMETKSKIDNLKHRLKREVQVTSPIIGFCSDTDSMRTAMCLATKFDVGAQHWLQLDQPSQKAVELDVLLSEIARRQKPEDKHLVLVVDPSCVASLVPFFADRLGVALNQEIPPIKEGCAISLVPNDRKIWSFDIPTKTNLSLATT